MAGRWTREEHHAFIKGLEMYGKGWKKIASLIKTRTVVQIRTHAQKYFLKLTKARQSGDANVSNDGKTAGTGGRKVLQCTVRASLLFSSLLSSSLLFSLLFNALLCSVLYHFMPSTSKHYLCLTCLSLLVLCCAVR
jgi:SHAQKYF class myb-like DNA-binding protein